MIDRDRLSEAKLDALKDEGRLPYQQRHLLERCKTCRWWRLLHTPFFKPYRACEQMNWAHTSGEQRCFKWEEALAEGSVLGSGGPAR